MCMNKPQSVGSSSLSNPSIVKNEEITPEVRTYIVSSSENSPTSLDDNEIIEFGPIKVKPRKKPAPTLATGRRSKYEVLSPEEEYRRDVRRARNRAAAERVRLSRLNVEQDLQGQIDALEEEENELLVAVQRLQHQKLDLQTRLLTHDKMCSSMTVTNMTMNPQIDLMSVFSSNDFSTSAIFQQVDNLSELHFDELLFDSPSPVQTQQSNMSNQLTTMTPHEELDDFLINL